MHLQRILSALVAVPCLYLLILKGGSFSFAALVSVAGLIALGEYYRIVFNKTAASLAGPIQLTGFITCLAIICFSYTHPAQFEIITGILVLNFILSGTIALFQFKDNPEVVDIVIKQVHGIIYISVLISSLILLRGNAQSGVAWVFYVLFLVAGCDTGAYYAGTYFGKHKLCPSVSPKKTIEGFLGGMVFVLITGLLIKYRFFPSLSLVPTVVFLFLVSIVGPCGDLYESILKRTGGIKDSGSIIPGHGGILDRIDALLFVAPVAYFFQAYIF